MTLETERLLLRPFREEDAEALYEYASDPRVGPSAGWAPHRDVEESRRIIRTVFNAPHCFAVVEKAGGLLIGSVGFVGCHYETMPKPDDEIGYALRPDRWGNGYIPEAVCELLRCGFAELGLRTIWCGHYDFNRRSCRVVEKCGFVYRFSERHFVEARNEECVELHYALTREQWEGLR